MTEQQTRVYDFIAHEITVNHCPPTRDEISAHFGWKSNNSAEEHIQALIRLGKPTRTKRSPRNIRLAPQPGEVAA